MDTTGKLIGAEKRNGKLIVAFQVDSESGVLDLKDEEKLRIRVDKWKEHRSLNANSYMWVLLDKIAAKISSTAVDVYRQAVRDVGVRTYLLVKNYALDETLKALNEQKPTQTGNFAEVMATYDDTTEICFYLGSSRYDTEQMSRLLDYVIYEANELNIDTKTPDEIEHLKEVWRCSTS